MHHIELTLEELVEEMFNLVPDTGITIMTCGGEELLSFVSDSVPPEDVLHETISQADSVVVCFTDGYDNDEYTYQRSTNGRTFTISEVDHNTITEG